MYWVVNQELLCPNGKGREVKTFGILKKAVPMSEILQLTAAQACLEAIPLVEFLGTLDDVGKGCSGRVTSVRKRLI
ncbi:MAG TPA: hypothetical protein VHG30_18085, partial [Microvirga sp.]|nr:hypothetical protein [Microvirga sp.]